MTSPQAGWYDDPWNPAHFRYWDGQTWTPHVAPKSAPPAWASDPTSPYQQSGQPLAPTFGPTTPDGAPLSGWWRRVGAKILDQLIVYVLALPLTAYFWLQAGGEMGDYVDSLMDASRNGGDTSAVSMPGGFTTHLLLASLLTALVGVVYETSLLRRNGATWGKRAAGIRVRPREANTQLSWGTIARRVGFVEGLALLSAVPVLGIAAGIAGLIDVLWPLWDGKRQALHDKVAGTNVVRSR